MTKLSVLTEGQYSVDESKKFIPFDPKQHQPKDRPASLFVHVQPFLLETKKDLILFDTGLGYSDVSGELIIHQVIKAHGYQPKEVTKVLISHLHFDHAGGMMFLQNDKWELSFPLADYIIQKEELNYALTKSSKSYQTEAIEELRRTSNLFLVEGEGEIDGYINFELTGGHCPYHQVFKVNTENGIYFFGGDIMPEALQVQRKMIAKYDFDGRKSMELRSHYAELAVEQDWKCLMYHDQKHAVTEFDLLSGAFMIKK